MSNCCNASRSADGCPLGAATELVVVIAGAAGAVGNPVIVGATGALGTVLADVSSLEGFGFVPFSLPLLGFCDHGGLPLPGCRKSKGCCLLRGERGEVALRLGDSVQAEAVVYGCSLPPHVWQNAAFDDLFV